MIAIFMSIVVLPMQFGQFSQVKFIQLMEVCKICKLYISLINLYCTILNDTLLYNFSAKLFSKMGTRT